MEILKLVRQYTEFTSFRFLKLADTDFNSGVQEHEKVIEALEERNEEKARFNMEAHFNSVVKRLVKHIQKNVPIGMFRLA